MEAQKKNSLNIIFDILPRFRAKDQRRPIRAGKLGKRMQIKVAILKCKYISSLFSENKIKTLKPKIRSVTISPKTKSTWVTKKNPNSLNWANDQIIVKLVFFAQDGWSGLKLIDGRNKIYLISIKFSSYSVKIQNSCCDADDLSLCRFLNSSWYSSDTGKWLEAELSSNSYNNNRLYFNCYKKTGPMSFKCWNLINFIVKVMAWF